MAPLRVRAEPLVVFRRLASVLDLTAEIATGAGHSERHAALGARLAILRARIAAGETSSHLVCALAEFGDELKSFMSHDFGFGRA